MKLYEATNGYMGFSYVRCLVYAKSYEEALDMAKKHFKEDGLRGLSKKHKSYWEDVELELILDTDTDDSFCTEITD